MRRQKLCRIALTAAALVLAAACSTNDARAPQVAEQPDAPAQAQAAQGNAPAAEQQPEQQPVLEHSEGEVTAPFVLVLSGPDSMPETGEVELTAKVTAKKELRAPATITIELPKNATLTAGKDVEKLPSLPAGELSRTFRVSLNGKPEKPIKLAVDVKDPGGAFGAHAERLFPEQKVQSGPPTGLKPGVPPPPVGRPPVGKAPTR